MIIGYLSKREVEERRRRWAEEALGLLAQQKPVDAVRLARQWNELVLAEEELKESKRRDQISWIVMIACTVVTTMIAGIAALIWGPSELFLLIIPSWIVVLPIYFWLEGKFKKKLNRRKAVTDPRPRAKE